MLLLALDTATAAVGAAIVDDGHVLSRAGVTGGMRHGEMLAPMVREALELAGAKPPDLTHIAVGTGPGPFTGLRVGLVHARVMALALGIEARGICTLDVLAAQVLAADGPAEDRGPRGFVVATDARRRELYWARYDQHGIRQGEPQVGPAAQIPDAALLPAFGAGAALYAECFKSVAPPDFPDPGTLGLLAAAQVSRGEPAGSTQPLYLRRPDAQVSAGYKKVRQ